VQSLIELEEVEDVWVEMEPVMKVEQEEEELVDELIKVEQEEVQR